MSDAVTTSEGYVQVAQADQTGLITLRGDLANAGLTAAVKKLTGLGVPDTGAIALKGNFGVAWMSPDELLILTPHDKCAKTATALCKALKSNHHLVANVSDSRAVFTLTGTASREVLAKLTPADLSPTGFTQNQMRRTRLAQVPVAFWYSPTEEITVVCFRSVADYVFDLLKSAAAPGSQINFF